ncbi:MAG: ATP-binding protein [bacterium]
MTNLRILAVDDETGMLSGINRALENFTVHMSDVGEDVGFETDAVETGEAAVERMKKNPPDIVLLDYKLPGMSGLDVLNEIGLLCPDTLTVMITAYASIETAIAATKCGAYDFLPKPFTPSDLRHTIRKATLQIVLARHARKLEAERKRVRFEFIRVLGHELKAPINAVAGYLYLMRDHALGDAVAAYNEAVGRSLCRIDQMHKLIADLLDMTRLESGKKKRNLETIDLVEVAKNALDAVRTAAESRKITMELKAPDSLRMEQADRWEMDVVFNNLLTNAVKYNKDKGKVSITIGSLGKDVVVSVADTGIGMTAEETAKLFHEFVRIKNDKTRNVLGSGLGLSILKRVVDLYHGRIDVKSKPAEGTTFVVTLKTTGPQSEGGE